jgi:hypothetical protein
LVASFVKESLDCNTSSGLVARLQCHSRQNTLLFRFVRRDAGCNVIGLYLLCAAGAVALLAYLASRYREYVDPDVELGAIRHCAVILLTCCVVLAFVFMFVIPVFTDRVDGPPVSAEPPPHLYSISGRVLDSSGTPVDGALVRATGPLFVAAVARNYETVSTARGAFRLDLLVGGGYNLFITAAGFEPTFLVSRRELADVTGDMSVPIMLRRRTEIQVQVGPAVAGPSQETDISIEPGGVSRADIPGLLMSQGIIASDDEIASVEEMTVSGPEWATYLRDGETIYPVTTWLSSEPACRITFVAFRAGRPGTLYILLRSGSLAFERGNPAGADESAPTLQETQQSDEGQMPTYEPRIADPPAPVSTSLPLGESQPTSPALTATSVAPVRSLASPQPQSASQPPVMPYAAPMLPPTNGHQQALPPVQQALPPIQQALPPIQQVLPPVPQALPPIQQVLPPVPQALPPIQQVLPPVPQALPPIQQALPPIQVPIVPPSPPKLPVLPQVPLPKLP